MALDINGKLLSLLVLVTSLFYGAKFNSEGFADGDASEVRAAPTLEEVAYLSPGEVSSLIQTQIGITRRSGKAPEADAKAGKASEDDDGQRKLTANVTSLLKQAKPDKRAFSTSKMGDLTSQVVDDLHSLVNKKDSQDLLGAGTNELSHSDKESMNTMVNSTLDHDGHSLPLAERIYNEMSKKAFITNSMRMMLDNDFRAGVEKDTGKKNINELINRLMHRTPVVLQKYNDLMVPRALDARYIALFGNIFLISLICCLSSTKSSYLVRDKVAEKKTKKIERAMRRDVTVAELKSHSLPGDIWVAVDGMVCDVSEFTANHPGGADVLLQHAGSDVSEQFAEVGHSPFANELIKARMVGVLTGGVEAPAADGAEGEEAPEPNSFVLCARRTFPTSILSLFTREDPMHFHKIVGVTVLTHYIVRFCLAIQGFWMLDSFPPCSADPMFFSGNWFSLASGWFCIVLSISSFQFLLPRNRVAGRPMLWQEWRAHNLIFVLRSLCAFTVGWYKMRYATTQQQDVMLSCVIFACVFAQLHATDVASRRLRDSKHESLTASWPLWEGCPLRLEQFLKFYYSIGINQLTYLVIQTGASDLPSMYLNFTGVVLLQSDSFAMTLVRKNIISTATFHAFYLWNMWHMAFLVLHTQGYLFAYYMGGRIFWWGFVVPMWGVPVAVYLCRYAGLSKYGCWSGFMAKVFLEIYLGKMGSQKVWLACPVVWSLWAIAQFVLSGYIFELRVRRFLETGRPKALVLKSRDRVTRSLYSLKFQMPPGYHCGMMPGQHIRVLTPNVSKDMKTWNGRENLEADAVELNRSYTPVSAPSADTFEIMVRSYAKDAKAGFPHGGRASTHLIEDLKVGEEILVSGPHGQRIYFGNGLFEVTVGQPKMRPRVVVFLAGGSGITPAISVMREVQAEARRKANTVEAERLMDYENEVGIEVFEVMHLNRMVDDALPLDFYKDPLQVEQLIGINVHNVVTGTADERLLTNSFESKCDGKCEWSVQESKLTKAVLSEAFPEPADDVLIIICGPHSFLNDCKPLLSELGFKHTVPMW